MFAVTPIARFQWFDAVSARLHAGGIGSVSLTLVKSTMGSNHQTLLLFVCTFLASLLSMKVDTSTAAEGPPKSLGFWVSKTIENCIFTVPLSFMAGLGRLSEEGLPTSWSGFCVNGLVSGQGTLRGVRDGKELFSYTGTMLAGALDGEITFHKAAGLTISAIFHAGMLIGPVTFSGPGGSRYEGGWSDKGPEGRGVMVQAGGGRYDGVWHDGRRNGNGIFVWPSGSRYEGNWVDGARTGHGVVLDAAGNRYEGEFKNGKRSGHGTFYYTNGVRLEAEWANDAAIGPASAISPTGARYDGGFRDGGPEGHGVAIEVNGDRYEGEWHEALPNGTGTLVRKADGSEFSGEWTRGCFADGNRHAAFHVDEASCAEH